MLDNKKLIKNRLKETGWFDKPGAYVLFDGQYGSTGKGLLASLMAELMGDNIDILVTNAGPNSGHTGYYGGEKIMTQQLPVATVVMDRMGLKPITYLNGGAVIEPAIFEREMATLSCGAKDLVALHPYAAVIKPEHQGEQLTHIASTGKGVGPAMADKLGRTLGSVVAGNLELFDPDQWVTRMPSDTLDRHRCFVETAQGWSLGINSGFYPYTTSRECSVAQAIADMGVSPKSLRKSVACIRTFPIRVGNTETGWSGPVYPDQHEITFNDLKQTPELTTVTKRVRRIFTWSDTQFCEMLQANRPDGIFLNFCNYMSQDEVAELATRMCETYRNVMGHDMDFLLMGWGPYNEDVTLWGLK